MDLVSFEAVKEAKRPLLLLSGGKDSVACYYLLKEFWDKLLVVFVNTGDAFPETLKIVDDIKKVHPLFLEVNSDVKAFREEFGNPFDVVVMNNTPLGVRSCSGAVEQKQCLPFDCCSKNLWEPVSRVLFELKPDVVIRGERKSEDLKSEVTPGFVENGITHVLPIYDWTDKQVLDYLESVGFVLPFHYFFKESSLDCMGCTAYSEYTYDRMDWMKSNYRGQFDANKKLKLKNLDLVKTKARELERTLYAQ